jgi:diguanylate cyclase
LTTPHTVAAPPKKEAPADAPERMARRRQLRQRMLATIAGSYGVTTCILLLYASVGTTTFQVPLWYACAGTLVWATFFVLFRVRLGERADDWFLTIWQLPASAAIELAFVGMAPEVGFVFLLVLFVVFGYGTLRLSPSKAVITFGATALSLAALLPILPAPLSIPFRTPAERWITALCFILTLGRCVMTGLFGSQYRIQLSERTAELRQLTGTLEQQVALRTQQLARANEELARLVGEQTDEIKTLQGILPICAHCKKIRDDTGAWNQLESYISAHTDVLFSHGICADCRRVHFPLIAPKR